MNDRAWAVAAEGIVFSSILPIYLGWLAALLLLGLLSLLPARRGNWLALLLNAPPMVFGAYAVASLVAALLEYPETRSVSVELLLMFSIPLLLPCYSMRVWMLRRRLPRHES